MFIILTKIKFNLQQNIGKIQTLTFIRLVFYDYMTDAALVACLGEKTCARQSDD